MADSGDKLLAKVAAILNKAENTDNEAERETFMRAASTMAAKYSFDLDTLREHTRTKDGETQNRVISQTFDIGTKGDRGAGTYSDLLIQIGEAHGMSWYRWGNDQVALYGGSFDMRYVSMIYPVVLIHMVQECNQFLREGTWKTPGVTRTEARYSFCLGYSRRVRERMEEARQDVVDEYESEGRSVALVLADKKREARNLYWREHKGAKTYADGRMARSGAGRNAGKRAGNEARISLAQEVSTTRPVEA